MRSCSERESSSLFLRGIHRRNIYHAGLGLLQGAVIAELRAAWRFPWEADSRSLFPPVFPSDENERVLLIFGQ